MFSSSINSSVLSIAWIVILLGSFANATIFEVTTSGDGAVLAAAALGDNTGLTLISSSYTGSPLAAGTYVFGPLGIHDGVILSTGHAGDAPHPESAASTNFQEPGSALCGAGGFHDAAVLTLEVATSSTIDGLSVSFIFATGEYPA